jgi:hypothetical protein
MEAENEDLFEPLKGSNYFSQRWSIFQGSSSEAEDVPK